MSPFARTEIADSKSSFLEKYFSAAKWLIMPIKILIKYVVFKFITSINTIQ